MAPESSPATAAIAALDQYSLSMGLRPFGGGPAGLELSAFELGALSVKIDSDLRGYYVNNVYALGEDALLLRMHRSERPDGNLIMDLRHGAWLTSRPYMPVETEGFVSSARPLLVRARFAGCSATEGERILDLRLEGEWGVRHLLLEFFGAGNAVVTSEEMVVMAAMKKVAGRDRTIAVGSAYSFPVRRAPTLDGLEAGALRDAIAPDAPVERGLGRGLQLPRRFVEEALFRAGVAKGTPGSSLVERELLALKEALVDMRQEAKSGGGLYIYAGGDGAAEPSAVRLGHLAGREERLYQDPFQAMDELLSRDVMKKSEDGRLGALLKEVERKRRRIEAARKQAEALAAKSEAVARIARAVADGSLGMEAAAAELAATRSIVAAKDGRWTVDGRPASFSSPQSLASAVFDESKVLARSAVSAGATLKTLMKEVDQTERTVSARKERLARVPRKSRRWFEAFRWFVTDGGCLAVGGRDAGSNSVLIRRHMGGEDLVFHAEVPGSPFFLLVGCGDRTEGTLKEVATATVSMSRAWREGLSAADAYYVVPSQVRLAAPSGMSMPRGSFMVEGERSYVKGIRLSLGVGMANAPEGRVVFCAPVEAATAYCRTVVEIMPGHNKPSWLAARLLKEFSADPEYSAAGLPSADELGRALPSGGFVVGRLLRGRDKALKMDWG